MLRRSPNRPGCPGSASDLRLVLGLVLSFAASTGVAKLPAAHAAPTPPVPAEADRRYSSPWVPKTLADYQRRYPTLTRLVKLGTTHEGRPIWALAIGRELSHSGDVRP